MKAEDIEILRNNMGLSRERFAGKIGATGASVRLWEKGITKPGDMALKLLTALAEKQAEKSSGNIGGDCE